MRWHYCKTTCCCVPAADLRLQPVEAVELSSSSVRNLFFCGWEGGSSSSVRVRVQFDILLLLGEGGSSSSVRVRVQFEFSLSSIRSSFFVGGRGGEFEFSSSSS